MLVVPSRRPRARPRARRGPAGSFPSYLVSFWTMAASARGDGAARPGEEAAGGGGAAAFFR